MQAHKISIVIPVYNEQDNLKKLFQEIDSALGAQKREWEVVFVDDGSSDNSLEVIRELSAQSQRVRYLSFEANQGQSAAFCAGFDFADYEVVVTMDADLQNDPADIPAMLDLFDQGHDMVIGWRAKRRDTWIKRISSKIGNAVRDKLTNDGVHDTGCSLKVMRTDMLRRLPRFKNMHRFFPILMKMQGADIAEVKVNHRPRFEGVSKYGTIDRALAGIYDLFGVRWLMNRHIAYKVKETE